jgi:hypothetical protein
LPNASQVLVYAGELSLDELGLGDFVCLKILVHLLHLRNE